MKNDVSEISNLIDALRSGEGEFGPEPLLKTGFHSILNNFLD